MKNLFKNLMLVAVAAMAFTACSQDVNEVNKIEKVTRYEFTANIADDTRSGFAEKEDGATAYKSEWFGNETLKLFLSTNEGWSAETTAEINTEGQFSFELTDAPESFFMTIVSPAESWSSQYSSTIPAEQTPLANSVDPKAHLLQSSTLSVSKNSGHFDMQHLAAYGKMTVNAGDFAIDHVVVDLKGSFYGSSRELSYTINADNVENNTFWFATEPIEVAEFTVTAYDAESNAVAKTVDVAATGKTLAFSYGRVSTFSVSNLVAPVQPEEPAVPAFTSAVVVSDWGSFDQVISFHSDELGTLEVEFYDQNVEVLNSDNWLKEGEYSLVEGTRNSLWYANFNEKTVIDITITVAWVGGKYHITFENVGGYNYETFFESAVFVGSITGGSIEDPDSRTRLDVPVVTAQPSEVEPAITFSWGAVDNAVEYELIFDGQTYTTTELSKTFSGLDYFKTYEVSVVAVADVNSETYRNSEATIAKARTIKDPNGPEVDPNAFTSCNYVSSFDSEGWGRKYEFSNESGAYLWLWVVQTAADESTGFMNSGIYNYHNSWADSVAYPGFVVKRMVLPGSSEESYIIDADMSVERNDDNHTIVFEITLEGETEPTTYSFSGVINNAL